MLWLSSLAPAETPLPRVGVLVYPDGPLRAMLRGELQFLGFASESVEVETALPTAAVERIGTSHDWVASIYVDMTEAQVVVAVVDRMTGKSLTRRLRTEDSSDVRVVAVKAVELLRASLLELQQTPLPVEREVDPPPQARAASSPPPNPRVGVFLGAVAAAAPGGLGVSWHLRGAISAFPFARVGFTLSGTAPLVATRVTDEEGSADIRIGWVLVGPRFDLVRRGVVHPVLGFGIGPAILSMQGTASAPYASGRDYVVTGLAEFNPAVEFVVAPRVRLRLGGAIGSCFTRPEVIFVERSVASWCLPYGLGELGVSAVW